MSRVSPWDGGQLTLWDVGAISVMQTALHCWNDNLTSCLRRISNADVRRLAAFDDLELLVGTELGVGNLRHFLEQCFQESHTDGFAES